MCTYSMNTETEVISEVTLCLAHQAQTTGQLQALKIMAHTK